MTRTTAPAIERAAILGALTLIPLVLVAACGDAKREPATTTVAGASTPAAAPATGSGGAETVRSSAIARNVSYADAESVYHAGRYDEAVELFDAYVGARPDNPWGHYMLGLAAWKAGDLARAERAFDRALELDPGHLKSYLNSARVLLDLDRAHEALERARLALELDSTSSDALRLVGRAHARLGRADSAVAAYRRVLALDDRDVWAMNNLGLLLIEQGQPERAIPPLARAVQLRANAPVFRNNLGIALERSGHLAAAKRAYEAAIAADSGYAKAVVSLARVTPLVDSTTVDTVDLDEYAEGFRLELRLWRQASVETTTDVGPDPEPALEPLRETPAEEGADTADPGEEHGGC